MWEGRTYMIEVKWARCKSSWVAGTLGRRAHTTHSLHILNELIAQSHDTAQLNKFATIFSLSPLFSHATTWHRHFSAATHIHIHPRSYNPSYSRWVRWLYSRARKYITLIASFAILLAVFFYLLLLWNCSLYARQPQPSTWNYDYLSIFWPQWCNNSQTQYLSRSSRQSLHVCCCVNPNRRHNNCKNSEHCRHHHHRPPRARLLMISLFQFIEKLTIDLMSIQRKTRNKSARTNKANGEISS